MDEAGRFWFDDSCSPEEIGALKPLLLRHEKLLPQWLDACHVRCETHDSDAPTCIAAMTTQMEYRRAHLFVYALWLNETPEHREQAIVHECMHLYTHAQRIFTKDVIILATPENKHLGDYLREQERTTNESTTEDLTLMLRRLGYFGA